ncbi:hypothetical protein P7K49_029162 [Saguinus oedipus]|uniref:Uncharacterized protein n=1 Tax=Saguinus oedipus TaxID=9490 RepID=A0ABQ9U7P7_SAGOE|nr:hypothetical protein P7K49_029162 [Saguinus oedipus]
MAELQQLRVQEALDSMVKSLEKENIRKMQPGPPSQRVDSGPLPQPPRDAWHRSLQAGVRGPGVAAAASDRTTEALADRMKSAVFRPFWPQAGAGWRSPRHLPPLAAPSAAAARPR